MIWLLCKGSTSRPLPPRWLESSQTPECQDWVGVTVSSCQKLPCDSILVLPPPQRSSCPLPPPLSLPHLSFLPLPSILPSLCCWLLLLALPWPSCCPPPCSLPRGSRPGAARSSTAGSSSSRSGPCRGCMWLTCAQSRCWLLYGGVCVCLSLCWLVCFCLGWIPAIPGAQCDPLGDGMNTVVSSIRVACPGCVPKERMHWCFPAIGWVCWKQLHVCAGYRGGWA